MSYKIDKYNTFASACEIWDIFVRMELAIRMRERGNVCKIDDICTGSMLNLICGLYKSTLNPLMKTSTRKNIKERITDLIRNEEELQKYTYDKKGMSEDFKRKILDRSDEELYEMNVSNNVYPSILERFGPVREVHGDWRLAYSITESLINQGIKFSLMNPSQFGYHEELSVTPGLKEEDAYIVLFTMFILEKDVSAYCHAYINVYVDLDSRLITKEMENSFMKTGKLSIKIPLKYV